MSFWMGLTDKKDEGNWRLGSELSYCQWATRELNNANGVGPMNIVGEVENDCAALMQKEFLNSCCWITRFSYFWPIAKKCLLKKSYKAIVMLSCGTWDESYLQENLFEKCLLSQWQVSNYSDNLEYFENNRNRFLSIVMETIINCEKHITVQL